MLQAIANLFATDGTTQLLFDTLAISFSAETESKLSQRFNSSGVLVTANEVKGTTTETGTIDFNEVKWGPLAFAFGQKARSVTGGSLVLPDDFAYETVPSTAPYEIEDAYITAGNDALKTILVTVTDSHSSGITAGTTLTRASDPATPADGEVGVDTTNSKLVFNSAQAGMKIFYPRYHTYSAYEDIGGPSGFTTWGSFYLHGEIITPDTGSSNILFYAPQVKITGAASFTLDNNVPTISVPISFGAPTGFDSGVQLVNTLGATSS